MNCETKTENFVYILVCVHKNETGDEVNAEDLKNNLASLGIMKDSGEFSDV